MVWMTCTQPLFFPPLYMMERFARCHRIVLMQEAQYSRHANHSWALLKPAEGAFRLKVSLRGKNRRPIDAIEVIDPAKWAEKTAKTLHGFYVRQLGYETLRASLDQLLESIARQEHLTLHRLNRMTMGWCLAQCGVVRPMVDSKHLIADRPEEPTAWLAGLAAAQNATDYLQGEVSIQDYFVPGTFAPHGIRVWGQRFHVPHYDQLDMTGAEPAAFDPLVSCLDALMVMGRDWVQHAIGARRPPGEGFDTVVRMEAFD
jgi:hypothetical protein